MAADAHHVLRRPAVRAGPGDPELPRQGAASVEDLADVGVDPGHEGLGVRPGRAAVGGPFGGHVPAIQEQPRGAVLLCEVRSEVPGQQAQSALAPEVDLPEPVPGGVVTLHEEGVPGGASVDVRDSPSVDADFGRRRQSRHLPGLHRRWRRSGGRAERRQGHQQDHRPESGSSSHHAWSPRRGG